MHHCKMAYSEERVIVNISSCEEIYEVLFALAPFLFNQEITGAELKSLANKYAEKATCTVVLMQGTPVAFTAYYLNDRANRTAFLSMIVVKGGYQRAGFGSLLLEHVICSALQSGMERLVLEVDINNNKARNFYNAHGFVFLCNKKTNSVLLSLNLMQ